MLVKVFYICLLLRLTFARYALPRQIAETTPEMPAQVATKLYYRPIQSYPTYQIITHAKPHKLKTVTDGTTTIEVTSTTAATSTTPSTSTTTLPPPLIDATTGETVYTAAEFPHDLLEIARHKLGLRSLDEVPSISELAEFLGTSNAEETIKYIRQLTSNDQGIALIRAYLESADYTDRTAEQQRKQQLQQQQVQETAVDIDAETPRIKAKKGSILERIAAYFHIYNLWPQDGDGDGAGGAASKQFEQLSQLLQPQLQQRLKNALAGAAPQTTHKQLPPHAQQKPMLVRNPLPYHYPVPLRPFLNNRLTHGQVAPMGHAPVHLNTPKLYAPPHMQLARMTNIPPQQLQSLIQSKPKLAQLAAKVSHYSLAANNDNAAQMNAQLMAAVRRAIEQDEDLKKLLQTTAASLL